MAPLIYTPSKKCHDNVCGYLDNIVAGNGDLSPPQQLRGVLAWQEGAGRTRTAATAPATPPKRTAMLAGHRWRAAAAGLGRTASREPAGRAGSSQSGTDVHFKTRRCVTAIQCTSPSIHPLCVCRAEAMHPGDCGQEVALINSLTEGSKAFLSREESQHLIKELVSCGGSMSFS